MSEEVYPIYQLLQEDPRYPLEAYQFVREALAFAHDELRMGQQDPEDDPEEPEGGEVEASTGERHLTGQQLCEAIRLYAIDQYGYMAKVVLNNWGLSTTGDFGNIVYNLIEIGWMKKSDNDRREHFDGVYDFDDVFQQQFEIPQPD